MTTACQYANVFDVCAVIIKLCLSLNEFKGYVSPWFRLAAVVFCLRLWNSKGIMPTGSDGLVGYRVVWLLQVGREAETALSRSCCDWSAMSAQVTRSSLPVFATLARTRTNLQVETPHLHVLIERERRSCDRFTVQCGVLWVCELRGRNDRDFQPRTILLTLHRRSQGCNGCTCTPTPEKKFWAKFTGESCKCTPGREYITPEAEQECNFLRKLGRFGRWERLFR